MKKIQVHGHQRSGTHFIASMIDINFFDGSNYMRHYPNEVHKLGDKMKFRYNVLYVYVWRDFEDVVNSMYNMRKRWGLNASSIEEFKQKKYCDMWDTKIVDADVVLNTNGNTRRVKKIAGRFKNVNMTPKEYWLSHLESWKPYIHGPMKNILSINYESMVVFPKKELSKLFPFLGELDEIKTVNRKVGWTPCHQLEK